MKSEFQKRASIVVMALTAVAFVVGLACKEITHASAGSQENKNRITNQSNTRNRTDNSRRGTQNSGNRNAGSVQDGSGTGANRNSPNSNTPDGPGNNSQSSAPSDDVQRRIAALEEKTIKLDDLWPLHLLVNSIGLGLLIFTLILVLLLHLIHFVRVSSLNRQITKLAAVQNNLAQVVRANTGQAINPAFDQTADKFRQLQQGLNDLSNRCNQIDNHMTVSDSQYRDAAHAVALAANWIGQAQLKSTMTSNGGDVSESERAATIAMLESYREPLRLNANRVEPITLALGELSGKLQVRSHSSPQVAGRIQSLWEGIVRFDQLHKQVTAELESLQRGSFAERRARLQAEQDRLFEQLNDGSLSVGQMVQKSRSLVEKHFPAEPTARNDKSLPLAEEANLKGGIDEAGEYLMDWYNNLFQLQAQLGQTQGSQADSETAAELAEIQQLASEALNRFDIQPEAIQIGHTSFDSRLHEAALVRPAPQYPINTVIDVHKCGFRRMTTGEVLRRPEVVVAGTTVG